jgi:hypothetical protein
VLGSAILERVLTPADAGLRQRWRDELAAGRRLEELIARRLLSKRYRKSPLTADVADWVGKAAAGAVRTRRPLRLLIPFGGYKSPRSPEHPGVGWAEVFAAAGMSELAAPICAFHPPGVVIEFSSDEPIASRLTGVPGGELERYRDDFERVLRLVGRYQPDNLTLRQSTIRDTYDVDELIGDVRERGRRLESEWFHGLCPGERDRLLRRAAGSRRAVCEHQAFLEIDAERRAEVFFERCTVPIALRRGIPGWLHLGSNRRSATQFWMGYGVVDVGVTPPVPYILPPTRATSLRARVRHMPIEPVGIEGLERLPIHHLLRPRPRSHP